MSPNTEARKTPAKSPVTPRKPFVKLQNTAHTEARLRKMWTPAEPSDGSQNSDDVFEPNRLDQEDFALVDSDDTSPGQEHSILEDDGDDDQDDKRNRTREEFYLDDLFDEEPLTSVERPADGVGNISLLTEQNDMLCSRPRTWRFPNIKELTLTLIGAFFLYGSFAVVRGGHRLASSPRVDYFGQAGRCLERLNQSLILLSSRSTNLPQFAGCVKRNFALSSLENARADITSRPTHDTAIFTAAFDDYQAEKRLFLHTVTDSLNEFIRMSDAITARATAMSAAEQKVQRGLEQSIPPQGFPIGFLAWNNMPAALLMKRIDQLAATIHPEARRLSEQAHAVHVRSFRLSSRLFRFTTDPNTFRILGQDVEEMSTLMESLRNESRLWFRLAEELSALTGSGWHNVRYDDYEAEINSFLSLVKSLVDNSSSLLERDDGRTWKII